MVLPVIISISGTQKMPGEQPETIQLLTEGTYSYAPGETLISYVESELTGLEGVVTTFTIEGDRKVTLSRTGKLSSTMVFALGQPNESLYDMGFGGLLIRVCATKMTTLLNEHGGIFDLEYTVDIEGTYCGTNTYHITVRPA